VININYY